MQELHLLNSRLDILLRKYSLLQAENQQLRQTVASQTQRIASLNMKLSDLEQRMLAMQMGSVVSSDEKLRLRHQVDNVIGEIDKILAKLND